MQQQSSDPVVRFFKDVGNTIVENWVTGLILVTGLLLVAGIIFVIAYVYESATVARFDSDYLWIPLLLGMATAWLVWQRRHRQ